MTLRGAVFAAVCTVFVAAPVSAQTPGLATEARSAQVESAVRVTFAKGRVTVIAVDATLGDILREWARAGGSRFTNIEKIPVRERVTIRLENETELRALDVLLRPLAGYAVTARAEGAAGLSAIDRVLIMPALSRPMIYGQATSSPANALTSDSQQQQRQILGPPVPDDDGPTRREVPPPPMNAGAPPPQGLSSPLGQASPLQGQTQTVPGLGVVTSSQPGAVIPNQNPNPNQNTARPGGRPGITPTQPRPGGGGG